MTTEDDMSSFEDSSQNQLDSFLSNHLDEMLDLYYDLQDRFHYMFGQMKSTHLTDLILVYCGIVSLEDSGLRLRIYASNQYSNFTLDYSEELNSSHVLLHRYMSEIKLKHVIPFDVWCKFCFVYCSH